MQSNTFSLFLKHIAGTIAMLSIAATTLFTVSCTKEGPSDEAQTKSEKYAFLYYCEGADIPHDLSFFENLTEAAKATAQAPDIEMGVLFKTSGAGEGPEHNGTRRYTSQDGALVEDKTFDAGEGFNATDPANLTDFLKWGAEQFPDRQYIFIFMGHGSAFCPEYDLAYTQTKATLHCKDGHIASAQFAQAVKDSGLELEALIAHSCLQGSIETLAEWEGIGEYILFSPISIPDVGYDYASMILDLQDGYTVAEALERTAERAMNIWMDLYKNFNISCIAQVVRLTDLQPLWDATKELFDILKNNLDGTCSTTEDPDAFGRIYGEGYCRAYYASRPDENDPCSFIYQGNVIDLQRFFHNCFFYSGNIALVHSINKLDAIIDEIVLAQYMASELHEYTFNIYGLLEYPENIELYSNCRFDKLTGWSSLIEALQDYAPVIE